MSDHDVDQGPPERALRSGYKPNAEPEPDYDQLAERILASEGRGGLWQTSKDDAGREERRPARLDGP